MLNKEINTDNMFALEQTNWLTVTKTAQFEAKYLAFRAIYDNTTGKVSLPQLSTSLESVQDQSSKTSQRDATISALTNIEDAVADQDHYLARSCGMPKLDGPAGRHNLKASVSYVSGQAKPM